MTFWGVVVAAGAGTRFGGPKHDTVLGGVPLWQRARRALIEGGAAGVVVVGEVPDGVQGGDRRRDSVAAGLARLSSDVEWVLVHDAARPLASSGLVTAVASRLERGDVDGVVPAIPLRDTMKLVSGDTVVVTVARDRLVAVQTPQGFRLDALRSAHSSVQGDAPDDAFLVESWGGTVATVPGEVTNVKITYPDDISLAEALVR